MKIVDLGCETLSVPTGTAVSASVTSALDVATWDLAGQAAGQPLWRLWGGTMQYPVSVSLAPWMRRGVA